MRKVLFCAVATATVALIAPQFSQAAVEVEFEAFNIRNHNGTIVSPWDSTMFIEENAAGNGFTASTPLSGQKVGYGTDAFDGVQLNAFDTVDFSFTEITAGVVPYLNFWVTDGTNYAIISSENVYLGEDFSTRQLWKVFEYEDVSSLGWLLGADDEDVARDSAGYLTLNGVRVTLADFANSVVLGSPTDPYPSYAGTGAPRAGYGFNIIVGDTAANYAESQAYVVSDLTVTVDGVEYVAANSVPEPATLAIWGTLSGLGLIATRRRKRLA